MSARRSTTFQSFSNALPTPTSTYKSRSHPIPTHSPNAGRSADYPSTWQVVVNKRTAKCRICHDKLSQSDFAVQCTDCDYIMCEPCWNGTKYTPDGTETHIEGQDRNVNGCWCQYGDTNRPPSHMRVLLDQRNARMQSRQNATTAAYAQVNANPQSSVPAKQTSDEREYLGERAVPQADDLDGQYAESDDLDEEPVDSDELANDGENSLFMPENSSATVSGLGRENPTTPTDVDSSQPSPVSSDEDQRLDNGTKEKIHLLTGSTTIIVGAGIVGMSIALELALRVKQAGVNHRIIVVEARESYAQLASGSCAGIIHSSKMPKRFRSLSKPSQQYWSGMIESDKENRFDYKAGSLEDAWNDGNVPARDSGWFAQDFLEVDSGIEAASIEVKTIDMAKYLPMLYRACCKSGVDFRFQSHVTDIYMQRHRCYIEDVEVGSADPRIGHRGSPGFVCCQNLIIAAGAFSTWILHDLFPSETALLENHIDEYTDVHGKPEKAMENKRLPLGRVLDGYKHTSVGRTSGMPVIDKIPWEVLGSINDRDSTLGIHMCYGFGRYGTSLAPGAAKVVVNRIFGEETGIDDAAYGLEWAEVALRMELLRQDRE
ncbi:hypothetical protein LTR95_014654 [Oleoguttula sp. CCFEE 5521]